jgi:carbamoyltransferase
LYVLGVNVAENPSACLIAGDGRTIATSEQQQDGDPSVIRTDLLGRTFCRVPVRAVAACLDSIGVELEDLDIVVVCGEVVHAPRAQPRNLSVADCMLQLPWSPRSRILTIDHHLAHACSAFYPSGFEDASILVVDRGGCVATPPHDASPRAPGISAAPPRVRASAYRANGGPPQRVFAVEDRPGVPGLAANSLGAMIELFASAIGCVDIAGLMDLATRGGDRLRVELERHVELTPGGYLISPAVQPEGLALTSSLLAHRFDVPAGAAVPACADAAWAVASLLQRVVTHLAMQLVERTGARRLCVAGDAAVHGLGRLDLRQAPWLDQLYIPPAAGEVGTAVGAALFGWCEIFGAPPPCELENAFRGRPYSDPEITAALEDHGVARAVTARRPEAEVLDEVADLLASGALVAWFEGGAELGEPLDRRCVLASPCRVPLAPRLDAGLLRAPFRALTAAVLVEDAEDYFELGGRSPFAHRVARVIRDRTREIPLVVRSDGTSRVQTVDSWRAPRLHDVIRRFQRRAGPPVLALAPLRQTGGPAVESPRDALRLWERAELDAIYLQGHLLVRSAPRPMIGDES